MNTLSWLIYAAEALSKISGIAGAVAILCAIMMGVALFFVPLICDFDESLMATYARAIIIKGGAFLLVVTTIYVASPSAKTLYMIAASEAGGQVVTSPDAIEMMGDLKAIIKKRLREQLED